MALTDARIAQLFPDRICVDGQDYVRRGRTDPRLWVSAHGQVPPEGMLAYVEDTEVSPRRYVIIGTTGTTPADSADAVLLHLHKAVLTLRDVTAQGRPEAV